MVRNPFRHAGPVGIDDLIDRDDEARLLLEAADEGNNSRLVAPRRYGKTSLLRRVLGEAGAGPGRWATVYVDFFGVVTLADVAERIERAYAAGLTGPLARWFEGVRRAMRPTLKAGIGPVGAEAAFVPPSTPLLERLALPVRVHERWGTRVLVVFDEFQEVLTAQPNADAVVRAEIQHHGEAASYVFAGSHVGMMHELFSDRRRAFYAQARPVDLPPLPVGATADYVTERFDGTGKDVGTALGPLLDLAAGHPQRTMLLAHALWAATPPRRAADEAVLAQSAQRVLDELSDEFRALWGGLPGGQRKVLAAVADGARPYARSGVGSRGGATKAALTALVDRGELVVDAGAPGGYAVTDPLLARWVRAGRRPDS